MKAEIDTRGFNKQQWDLFYQIRNLEWKRDKLHDELEKYPNGVPYSKMGELTRYSWKIKRNRAALIELTSKIENNTENRRNR